MRRTFGLLRQPPWLAALAGLAMVLWGPHVYRLAVASLAPPLVTHSIHVAVAGGLPETVEEARSIHRDFLGTWQTTIYRVRQGTPAESGAGEVSEVVCALPPTGPRNWSYRADSSPVIVVPWGVYVGDDDGTCMARQIRCGGRYWQETRRTAMVLGRQVALRVSPPSNVWETAPCS